MRESLGLLLEPRILVLEDSVFFSDWGVVINWDSIGEETKEEEGREFER